ncbi:hypothetical protein HS041_04465 [Planomonospora sp. ID67723]|uniref:hypothetical protein n=1 Tax=Planomonospora sp. ID67723 TaxID=2738134 RepID=UPI0018C39BC9|nr:hypothetical protein [Planomonospora sp. ID67723]MBG0827016.1 hypothetical protein [Planomonospora sp. ID67723]
MKLLIVVVVAIAAVIHWSGRVRPYRIESFARRQSFGVTPITEPVIRHYLRLTRRWRSVGLVAGALLPVVMLGSGLPPVDDRLAFAALPVSPFTGWFLGALGAELTLACRRRTGPGATPAFLPALVSPAATWSLRAGLILGGASLAVWAAGAVSGTGLLDPLPVGLGMAGAGLAALLVRSLRERPIPLAPLQVVAAVCATRSRSAHVLAAAAPVFVLCCVEPVVDPRIGGELARILIMAAAAIAVLRVGTPPWRLSMRYPLTVEMLEAYDPPVAKTPASTPTGVDEQERRRHGEAWRGGAEKEPGEPTAEAPTTDP